MVLKSRAVHLPSVAVFSQSQKHADIRTWNLFIVFKFRAILVFQGENNFLYKGIFYFANFCDSATLLTVRRLKTGRMLS